jgi:enoyl-CoA hydratase/carnithine racemase
MNEADQTLILERRGPVLWMIVNRPERRNAYTGAFFHRMIATLAEAETDPSVLAVVLTGAGDKAFSTGADLKPDTDYSPLKMGEEELVHPAVAYFRAADAFSTPGSMATRWRVAWGHLRCAILPSRPIMRGSPCRK